MHPELFHLGPFNIKSYGLLLALSFFLGVILAVKRAQKAKLEAQQMIDLCFVVMIAAIIGSRFFYVIYHTEEFAGHWLDTINPFQSSGQVGIAGLSMMGGVVLAIIAALGYFIIKKINPWTMLDALAPSFFLGEGLTRIGCFLNGCCFGKPTHSHLGIIFPPDSMAGWVFPNQAVWPTQLFSSAAGFIMAGLLLFSEKKKTFNGYTFFVALGMYSIWRFAIDFFRYYEDSMIFMSIGDLSLSRNQFLCICLLIISIWWFIYLKQKNEKAVVGVIPKI
jgi:phosphatidylglycerol---prolipoprotein diacylglyceryl transferase